MYNLQSRYYDPEVGRFLNADDTNYLGASGTTLGYNLYAYCENNVINFTDYSGNYTKDSSMGIISSNKLPGGSYYSYTIKYAKYVTWAVTSSFSDIAKNHCAAVAVTNLALYFHGRGYSRLMVDTRRGVSIEETFKKVHKIVGNGPVMVIANKAKKYFKERGYSLNYSSANSSYSIKQALKKDRPVGILISNGLFSWHWIICVGYREYYSGAFYMQVVDGWNNTIDKYYKPHSGSVWISGTQYWI